jgi:hypothetical protein
VQFTSARLTVKTSFNVIFFINAGYIARYRCRSYEDKFFLVCGAVYIVMLMVPAGCRVTSFMKTEKGG